MRPLIIALSLLPFTASAAVITVPTDSPTIQSAVDAAVNGDQIVLLAGTYDEHVTVDKTLIIKAAPDAVVVITNTTGTTNSVFDVTSGSASFSLEDVVLAQGTSRAVHTIDVPTVSLKNVSASTITVPGPGAVAWIENASSVSLEDITADDLIATQGGAVNATREDTGSNATMTLRRCSFELADVTGSGGFVYATNFRVNIEDSTLSGGNAAGSGGAVFASNLMRARTATFLRSQLSENTAGELGGGAYVDGMSLTLNNAEFIGNAAGSAGGVWHDQVAETGVTLNVRDDVVFSGNTSTGVGTTLAAMDGRGAAFMSANAITTIDELTVTEQMGLDATVWITSERMQVDDSSFTMNTATAGAAGALWTEIDGDLDIEDSIFADNLASLVGGAAAITATEIDLNRVGFANNASLTDGGAVWASGELVLRSSTFSDNMATRGGAVFGTALTGDVSFTDLDWFRNDADVGGAVHLEAVGELNLTRNTYCENTSSGAGGAILASGTGSVLIRNDGANRNTAAQGAVYSLSGFGDIDLQFSTYNANAATNGGVLYAQDIAGTTVAKNDVFSANSGPVLESTSAGALTARYVGSIDNASGTVGGTWATSMVADPIALDDPYRFNNSDAGIACEDVRLYPHARNTSLRTGAEGGTGHIGLSGGTSPDPLLRRDGDGDGDIALDDCNDSDATLATDAPDICDGIDNDCDNNPLDPLGGLDEDPDVLWFADADSDTFGDSNGPFGAAQCEPPPGQFASNDDDCDDADPAINPGVDEICDGIDNDCDNRIDLDAVDALEFHPDVDRDTYGDVAISRFECVQPAGFTSVGGDCNDRLANVYPGAVERCDTIDNDCDGRIDIDAVNAPTWYLDGDLDGFGRNDSTMVQCLPPNRHSPFGNDCDDVDPSINPGANEVCDGIDNNCSGDVDVNPVAPLYYIDGDGDGFGDRTIPPVGSCAPLPGFILTGRDCNDADLTIFPGAAELCDGIDQDCDGEIDDNPTDGNTYFLDSDRDGFGNTLFPIQACALPTFASEVGGDCNDQENTQYPGNDEVCDFRDNDCDGVIDEPDAIDAVVWYADVDDDNFGNDEQTAVGCRAPIGHVAEGGDCNDENASSFPGRLEVCDGVDNDCNGQIDGPDAADVSFFYEDADGDGFGDPTTEIGACFLPPGYTTNNTDCDDTDDQVNPGSLEIAGNGIDEDCSGGDLPGDTPTAPPGEGEGCGGCSNTTAPPFFALLPLFGLLALRRRR